MENQTVPGAEPEEPTAIEEREAESEPESPAPAEASAEPLWRPRMPRLLRPWEALERLDRQWGDPTPLADLAEPISALALTTEDDPRGWDYLGALIGSSTRETADACQAWLEAQLAADAVTFGRAIRHRVDLVPSGRRWYVVRTVADVIVVIDGPGFPTPLVAAIAASRRYHAELLRTLERAREADAAITEDGPVDGAPADGEPGDRP